MAAREGRERREQRRTEQGHRQHHEQQPPERGERHVERRLEASRRQQLERQPVHEQRDEDDREGERGGREDLAADDGLARGRRREQRLERLPLALARRRVDGELHAADEREQKQQVRQHLLGEVEARLGRRDVAAAHEQRVADGRVNPARNQPERPDLRGIGLEQPPHACNRGARLQRPRAVVYEFESRRPPRPPVGRVGRVDAQDDLVLLRAHRRIRVRGRRDDLHVVCAEPDDEIGRPVDADHGQFERALELLGPATALGRAHSCEDQRHRERHDDERHEQHAPVAQRIREFLAEHRPERPHASNPSPEPITLTNASSRFDVPACSRKASGVPSATTLPRATTTMRSQSAATSCMM